MAIGSLALGIGGNVTVYSVVREMILDDLSAARPHRLVRAGANVSYTQYRELRQAGVFQDVAFYHSFRTWNWRAGDHSEIVWTIESSPNFFDVLGVRAGNGRLFGAADADGSVVASYGFWKRGLGADPRAIGRPIELNGRLYPLVGVLPEDYRSVYGLSVSPEIYVRTVPASHPDDASWIVFGRLRDGQSVETARQELAAAAERMWGAEFARRFATLRPMAGFAAHTVVEGNGFYLFFVALFAVAGMMALISCANVAGLLVARGLSRQRELAIRKALGASRWQVARPLLAEASMLVAAGGAAGLLLHAFLAAQLRAVRFPSAYGVPFEFHFRNDGGLLLYAAAVALAALAVSALAPAMRGSGVDLGLALKQGEPAFSLRRWNLRSAFVALQMALAVMLLALGALFARSFVHVATADLGFDAEHILMAGVQRMPQRMPQPGPEGTPGGPPDDGTNGYRERLLRRIRTVPGVVAVSSTSIRPLAGELPKAAVRCEGDTAPAREVYVAGVGERYCETMGIAILRGRDFRMDDGAHRGALGGALRARPAIVNRTLARQFFGDGDPVGQQLRLGRERTELLEVVGVAADSKLRSLGEENVAALYVPEFGTGLLVRVAGDAGRWIAPLRRAMAEIDPQAALDIRPMADAVAGGLFPMRMAALLVGSLSTVGLLLALVGLYAAVSHAVGKRTREMGIRVALGATRGSIVWVALGDGMGVLGLGAAVGLALAVAAIRPLAGIVPDGVNPWDPAQFAAVLVLLLAAGAAATAGPARRAARVDAAVALREE
ncbi:MAG: ABC transporter permease [Bryobacteraceae bacterium]